MAKVKVLHLIKSLGRGGAEMLLQETLKQHDTTKFEFHYIYFLPWKNQMVEGLLAAGGKVTNFSAKNNVVIMLQAKKVIDYIQLHQIDIVHCHLPWAGFLGRLIHWRIKIPVLYSEHNKQERYHAITSTINKLTFNSQSKVIAVSADVAASIQKNIHSAVEVKTILNGVDTKRFVKNKMARDAIRQQYSIPANAVLIGTIAVFRFQKRLKEWIDLFKIVADKNPSVYGCIIGDGPLNESLRQHVKQLGLEDRIIMPGLQTDVLPWLSAIDIFLMTSEFEGLPVALLEAMSMECAVVCTNAGGISEVIRNNQDGFLMPIDQWQQLADPLNALVLEPAEIEQWGFRARKRVVDHFDLRAMIAQTESLYLSILQ